MAVTIRRKDEITKAQAKILNATIERELRAFVLRHGGMAVEEAGILGTTYFLPTRFGTMELRAVESRSWSYLWLYAAFERPALAKGGGFRYDFNPYSGKWNPSISYKRSEPTPDPNAAGLALIGELAAKLKPYLWPPDACAECGKLPEADGTCPADGCGKGESPIRAASERGRDHYENASRRPGETRRP